MCLLTQGMREVRLFYAKLTSWPVTVYSASCFLDLHLNFFPLESCSLFLDIIFPIY